jgi:DNA-binding protein H-NS
MSRLLIDKRHLSVVNDLTECPICREVYTDPRTLPCMHTYCLDCLNHLCKNRNSGADCPMCRKHFVVPDGGISELPKAYYIEKLLMMRRPSSTSRVSQCPCDVCGASVRDVTQRKLASVYCVTCNRAFCTGCHQTHRDGCPSSRNRDADDAVTNSRLPQTYCSEHDDRCLQLLCLDCHVTICSKCFVKSHKSHDVNDIDETASIFRQQLKADAKDMADVVQRCRRLAKNVEKYEKDINLQVSKCQIDICDKANELIELINRSRQEMLDELAREKRERATEIGRIKNELQKHISFVESMRMYNEELASRGTAVDLARETRARLRRSDELRSCDAVVAELKDFTPVTFAFEPLTSVTSIDDLAVGEIRITYRSR